MAVLSSFFSEGKTVMRKDLFVFGWFGLLWAAICFGVQGAVVTVSLDVDANINSTPITATGTIVGDSTLGTYHADIAFSSTVPKWDLLSVYWPMTSADRYFSREIDIGYGLGTNFDTLTGGNFFVNRTVTFEGSVVGTATFSGQLASTGPSTIDLTGTLTASGDWTPFGTIVSIGTYHEYFTPVGAGAATSYMEIPFLMSGGGTILAKTSSTYTFNPLIFLPGPQLGTRSFTFDRNSDTEFTLDFEGTVAAVPEPSTMMILGLGISIGFVRRRLRTIA
jgi:hypothetical protein